MQTEEFIDRVQGLLGLEDRIEAEDAVRATLETLGRRLSFGEAADLADRLPAELGEHLRRHAGGQPETFGLDVFFQHVATGTDIDVDVAVARDRAQGVMTVLRQAVGDDEIRAAASQLPSEYSRLLEEAAS